MESKVKQMCYEMMLNVLDEHQNQNKTSFKPKPVNFKPLKHKQRKNLTIEGS